MTDNDIIKALECCDNERDCTQCPMKESYPFCDDIGAGIVLDLIKRQQAEIERCKKLLNEADKKYDLCAKRFFKEGVKEFAARLKCGVSITSGIITCEDIDKLVKEMTEEGGGE